MDYPEIKRSSLTRFLVETTEREAVHVEAYRVKLAHGDLVFSDKDGEVVRVFAKGAWRQVYEESEDK